MKHRLLLLIAVAAFVSGCGSDQTGSGNSSGSTSSGPTGRIRGTVRLVGNLPSPEVDAIKQDQSTCGTTASLPRLVLGKEQGIQNAFVFLEGVKPSGSM